MTNRAVSAAMELQIRGADLAEGLSLIPLLREHVAIEVGQGGARESFLFSRAVFVGTAAALARLRAMIAERAAVEVTVVSNDTLGGLCGKPVTAMELVLDPEGAMAVE